MEFILLIVAIGVGVIIWQSNRRRKEGQSDPSHAGSRDLRIENMQTGGVFSLRNFGSDMDDLDVEVLGRHIYDEDGYEWAELEGETGGRKIWLTVEVDDELELSVTLRKLKLQDVSVTSDQLDQMKSSQSGSFNFEDKTYNFDESSEAVFYRNGDRQSGERHAYWDFESTDGGHSISFERWADGSFDVHISQILSESQITVYAIDGGE
jgi:hypothetical protein